MAPDSESETVAVRVTAGMMEARVPRVVTAAVWMADAPEARVVAVAMLEVVLAGGSSDEAVGEVERVLLEVVMQAVVVTWDLMVASAATRPLAGDVAEIGAGAAAAAARPLLNLPMMRAMAAHPWWQNIWRSRHIRLQSRRGRRHQAARSDATSLCAKRSSFV